MHIKQVIISGFRSFRSQAETEPFSPRHNVIVGRNGSGKSNFFDAIQFVLLNQKFFNLPQQDRQNVLHEGAGAHVMSAFVEIVFDNSDGRLAADGDEVVLRRTIGLKKDEFFLNRKRVTKPDVSSLLESAGFSKSNPYYIVQQGKVSTLTLMHDSERLNLLKEVAGTKVYDERRTQSVQIMADTTDKLEKIQEVIAYIDNRLSELEGEKDELGAYQQLDRDRRALEYTIYDKELRKAREDLEMLDDSSSAASAMDQLHEVMRAVKDSIKDKEEALVRGAQRTTRLERDKAAVDKERSELTARRTALELEVKEIQEGVATDGEAQSTLAAELKKLERTVAEKEAEMTRVVAPKHDAAKAAVQAAEARLAEASAAAEDLYARQSRHSQFATAAERDASLRTQIKSITAAAKTKSKGVATVEATAAELKQQLSELQARATDLEEDIKSRNQQCTKLAASLTDRVQARDEMAEQRKEKWRQLDELQERVTELKTKFEQGRRDLRSSTPRAIADGLEQIDLLVARENIPGVMGPVIENFSLADPKFTTAVEVAAGNALFNVIVDTDATAARLMQHLERNRSGRLTFMPLNRLHPREQQYPASNDVAPLIEIALKFDPRVTKAMKEVFGRKLLVRDQSAAESFSGSAGMDCVTMEGDEVGRKGGITGGYRDAKKSRLAAIGAVKEASAALDATKKAHTDLTAKVQQMDQAVTKILGEIERLKEQRHNARHVIETNAGELTTVRRQATQTEASLAHQLDLLPGLRAEAQQETARAALLEREIGTPLEAGLAPADQARLTELNTTTIPNLRSELQQRYQELETAASEQQRLAALLSSNLLVRRTELRERLDPEHGGVGSSAVAAAAAARQEALTVKQAQLAAVLRAVDDNRDRLNQIESELLERRQAARVLQDELETLKAQEGQEADQLNEASKNAEKLLGKRTLLLHKRDEFTRKIQELGSLPTTELQRFAAVGAKALMKKLHEANEKLKKYSHVNKKALDQFVSFSEQRETLLDRKAELDKGDEAIQELITALDQQKDEAIQNTFRSVSKHFKEVFSELVPQGSGQLIMLTRAEKEDKDSDDEDSDGEQNGDAPQDEMTASSSVPQNVSISAYIGVQVRVAFGASGDTYLMSQLSGGQKALVALALIFAIQRCDPAPFYLFDEIDQALDSSYRAALASLIQKQAHSKNNPTQFITTTFRPELVSVASRAYGISHQNKVSNIELMTREEALGFVAEILNEEEAVGTALVQPKGKSKSAAAARKQRAAPARAAAPASDNEDEIDDIDEQGDAQNGDAPHDSDAMDEASDNDEQQQQQNGSAANGHHDDDAMDADNDSEPEQEAVVPAAQRSAGKRRRT